MIKANIFFKLLITLLVISLVIPLAWPSPVRAQSTVLAISPASSTALTCDDTIIKVRVQDVVNLYGYDISVSFTSSIPGAIEIVDVSNSGFLDFGTQYVKSIDNATGKLRYAMSQNNPSTAKSGSGDLISIHIHALTSGATVTVTIVTTGATPTKLSAIGGIPITFTTSNGSLTTSNVCPPAELSISPSPVIACTNADLTLKVRVRYVVNLYGYHVEMSFNPGSIQIKSVTNGGFLEVGFLEPTNGYDNNTGMILFGNAQISPALPKTGTGDLISITLRATVANQTVNLNINESNSDLVDSELNPISFSASDGVIYTSSCDPTSVPIKISGNVGIGGATITYSGGSTIADAIGNYSFKVRLGWTGIVIPSLSGYTFSPAYKSYLNVQEDNSNQDFTAQPINTRLYLPLVAHK